VIESDITKIRPSLDHPDQMLRDRNLDPDDWVIDNMTLNEWESIIDNQTVTLYQLKFIVKRKSPLSIWPSRSDGWVPPKRARYSTKNYETIVVVSDFHAPFHEKHLNECFCEWLRVHKPDRGYNLGDLLDLPEISVHKKDPDNAASINQCIQAGYDILRSHIDASPDTQWELLDGNHDAHRLRDYILRVAPEIYGIRQASSKDNPGQAALDFSFLLRLDELGIKYIVSPGGYEDSQSVINKNLAVRHGWIAKKGAGATARATLEQTLYSILIGHVHRQGLVYKTKHEIDRSTSTLLSCEVGCMCRIDSARDEFNRRYPSYTVLPDWQQGFAVIYSWPDGKFKVELANYVNNVLLFENERYE